MITALDLTDTLKVTGVTLLTTEQVESLPKADRRVYEWYWLRSAGNDASLVGMVDDYGNVFSGGDSVNVDEYGIRPVLLISNWDSLGFKDRRRFLYKDLEWKLTTLEDRGRTVAICNDVLRDVIEPINIPFRECTIDRATGQAFDLDGNPIKWDNLCVYEYSTIKEMLDKWATKNGIIST